MSESTSRRNRDIHGVTATGGVPRGFDRTVAFVRDQLNEFNTHFTRFYCNVDMTSRIGRYDAPRVSGDCWLLAWSFVQGRYMPSS